MVEKGAEEVVWFWIRTAWFIKISLIEVIFGGELSEEVGEIDQVCGVRCIVSGCGWYQSALRIGEEDGKNLVIDDIMLGKTNLFALGLFAFIYGIEYRHKFDPCFVLVMFEILRKSSCVATEPIYFLVHSEKNMWICFVLSLLQGWFDLTFVYMVQS